MRVKIYMPHADLVLGRVQLVHFAESVLWHCQQVEEEGVEDEVQWS